MNIKTLNILIVIAILVLSVGILVGAYQMGVKQGEGNVEYMESDEHANWSQTLTKQAGEIFDLEEKVERLEDELEDN